MTTSVPGASENPSGAAKPAEPLERVDSSRRVRCLVREVFSARCIVCWAGPTAMASRTTMGRARAEAAAPKKNPRRRLRRTPQVEGTEPSEPPPAAEASARTCPACGSPLPDAGPCGDCGFVAAVTPTAGQGLTPLETGGVLRCRFEIVEHRGRRDGVHIYSGKESGGRPGRDLHEAMADAAPPAAEQPSIADDSTAVSPPEQEDGSAESGATDAFFAGLSDSGR
jgi:hypothetical protein